MSLPHWTPARKPKRLGLWLPFALLIVGVCALAVTWFWMRREVERRMEDSRAVATSAGWMMDWDRRSISGFPFRLDVTLYNPRVREPSGWGVAASNLKAEAFVFAPAHWVMVVPSGVVITRRRGRPLVVEAKALRASVSEASNSPPRISIEGLGLTFMSPPGAAPFLLRSATEFHFHAKSGPHNQGAAYVEIDGASARLEGLLSRIADNHPAKLILDVIYSDAASLSGPSWPAAIRHWAVAGGAVAVRRLSLDAGQAEVDAQPGCLGVGADGRLRGRLELTLRQAPRALTVMGSQGLLPPETARAAATVASAMQQGPTVNLPLSFQAGRTTLGPIAIGPAPRIY